MAKRFAKWLTVICIVCCMAMVFAFTGCKTESARKELTSVTINDAGHLIATYSDESTEDLGSVIGAKGDKGDKGDKGENGTNGTNGVGISEATVNENGEFVITYTDGSSKNLGKVTGNDGAKGDKGDKGDTGVGIKGINTITKEGKLYLRITLDDANETTKDIELPTTGGTTACDHKIEKAEVYELQAHEDGHVSKTLYVWNNCGHSKLEVGTHTMIATDGKAATCTEAGYKAGQICEVCQYKADTEEIPALGHDWDEGTVTTDPTCLADGVKTFECKREGCDETKTEAVEKLGHKLAEKSHYVEVANKPICTNNGFSIQVCEHTWKDAQGNEVKCDYAVATAIEKLGHQSEKWTLKTPATEETPAVLEGLCVICGEKATIEVPLTEWTKGEEQIVCNEKGTIDYTYTKPAFEATIGDKTYTAPAQEFKFTLETKVNFHLDANGDPLDDSKSYVYDDALKARGVKLFVNKEVTCKDGELNAVFICKRCEGAVGVKVTVPHADFNGDTENPVTVTLDPDKDTMQAGKLYVLAPKCEDVGHQYYLCPTCGEKVTKDIPATGHDPEFTVEQDGDKWYYSAKCRNANCDYEIPKTEVFKVELKETKATCTAEGVREYTIWITEDSEPEIKTEKLAIIPHYISDAEGNKIFELDESKVYDWNKDLENKGVKLLVNRVITCKDEATNAVFTCSLCKEPVGVNVRVPHNAPKVEKVTEITLEEYEALTWNEETQTGTFDPTKVYKVLPTCEKDGITEAYICTVCGKLQYKVDAALGHNMVTKTRTEGDKSYYWTECTRCDKKTDEVEGIVKTEVKTPATCEVEGVMTVKVYETDGTTLIKTYEEEIAKTAHKLNGELMPEHNPDGSDKVYPVPMAGVKVLANSAPACNEAGYGTGVFECEVCHGLVGLNVKQAHSGKPENATIVEVSVLPEKADMEAGKLYVIKATCTTPEQSAWLCSACGERQTETGKANGHEFVYTITLDPTTEAAGTLKVTCAKCDYHDDTVEIPKLANGQEVSKADCTKIGLIEYTATVKDEAKGYDWTKTYTEETPKTGHNTVDSVPTYKWEFEGKQYTGKFCKACGKVIVLTIDGQPV